MPEKILITGLGLITPLGNSVEQTWSALLAGQFIRDHAALRDRRIENFATDCAKEAIAQAGWSPEILSDPSTALIVGTSKGPVKNWLISPPQANVNFGLAELATNIAAAIGHSLGPRATLSAACASGIHALIHAAMLIRAGQAKRAIVVAAEASVHPLFVSSFKRLGVLPPEGFGCRPFDVARRGFLISEAAAAVCIESAEVTTSRPFATIENFSIGSDAAHLTGNDPAGRTLRHLLKNVVAARTIDLVHAHATGTQLNDAIELSAIESCAIGEPSIYSHKGALGHSLGAAGLISIVLNCLSHRSGIVLPNVQTHRPMPSERAHIAKESVQRSIKRSIAIAAGFGGAMGTISLASV
jgi:3-oxoacyl-[acyl-carrier-protein] synthase II